MEEKMASQGMWMRLRRLCCKHVLTKQGNTTNLQSHQSPSSSTVQGTILSSIAIFGWYNIKFLILPKPKTVVFTSSLSQTLLASTISLILRILVINTEISVKNFTYLKSIQINYNWFVKLLHFKNHFVVSIWVGFCWKATDWGSTTEMKSLSFVI